ncbi:hypothetical protein ZOSMA_98G00430 [Zostera marina]|uniref:Uncharacterized protein n=1 Tax=Zostera marina TaxID=29655 RepID=A0A0K9NHX2_ZOSMR|nr:hypothetical protein ZOSMA_98G00430 [Zostera marina]
MDERNGTELLDYGLKHVIFFYLQGCSFKTFRFVAATEYLMEREKKKSVSKTYQIAIVVALNEFIHFFLIARWHEPH